MAAADKEPCDAASFEAISELGERSVSFEPLYFAGNALAHGAALLLVWTLWRIAVRSS